MKLSSKTRNLILVVGLIGPLLAYQACQAGNLQLEYVFPDGFRGLALIRENQNDGSPACEIPWLPRTEVCVLNFPASGVIHTQGVSPTTVWHRATARYANGTAIPVPNRAAGIIVAEDEVAVWYGQGVEGEGWLFVGTSDEFREFNIERSRPKY